MQTTMVALNYATIAAAAASLGITSHRALLRHLGLKTLEPVTALVLAILHCRLGIPFKDLAQVTRTTEPARERETG